MSFPLFNNALQAGVLQTGNGLIVAPTATGKSFIGRRVIHAALEAKEKDVHAYLIPYRVLANEMYHSFIEELGKAGIHAAVRIATEITPIRFIRKNPIFSSPPMSASPR